MPVLGQLRRLFERALEAVTVLLMVALAVVVALGIAARTFGAALVWYDEVASILLAWLTYYGSALAALKRAHIGFADLLKAAAPRIRLPLTLFAKLVVVAFFALLAWVGWRVLQVLDNDYLVSLPAVSSQLTQSVIPIGALLFILAEIAILPEVLAEARAAPRRAAKTSLEFQPGDDSKDRIG